MIPRGASAPRGIFRRTGLYRISRYRLALDDATKTPVQKPERGCMAGRGLAVFHFVYRKRDRPKPDLIGGKRVLYRLYRFFGEPLCVRVRACVRA